MPFTLIKASSETLWDGRSLVSIIIRIEHPIKEMSKLIIAHDTDHLPTRMKATIRTESVGTDSS